MTLKEKFDKNVRYDENGIESEMCVIIAEEFAIGFAKFSIDYNYHSIHKVWIRYDKIANEIFTTKELLEIYKKESNY